MNDTVKESPVGVIKEIKEIVREKEPPSGLQNMSREEADNYLASLAKKLGPKLDGLEETALKKLKEAFGKIAQANKRIKQLDDERAIATEIIQKLNGQVDVLSDLLVSAEDARRGEEK